MYTTSTTLWKSLRISDPGIDQAELLGCHSGVRSYNDTQVFERGQSQAQTQGSRFRPPGLQHCATLLQKQFTTYLMWHAAADGKVTPELRNPGLLAHYHVHLVALVNESRKSG